MKKPKIIILYDSISASADEEDTLEQAQQISGALDRLGYLHTIETFTQGVNCFEELQRNSPKSIVFNLVETYLGAQFLHLIPLYAKKHQMKCTGGDVAALFLSGDKLLAKRLMKKVGIPTPMWLDSSTADYRSFVGKRLMVKPRDQEASVGITDASVIICSSLTQLTELHQRALKENLLIEEFVGELEFNVSIITKQGKPIVLPVAQMIYLDYPPDKPKIVGYEAKWEKDSFAYQHTNRSFAINAEDPLLVQKIQEVCLACWDLFGCPSYARVDLRSDADSNLWVLEMNVNPSINEDSGFIAACSEAGYAYDQVIELIISEAQHE